MEFPKRQEYKYTKADLLNFFGFLKNKKIIESNQFMGRKFFYEKKFIYYFFFRKIG